MPIIGFRKQGTGTIKTPHGPKIVGLINIRTSEREAAPVDNIYWYELHREESILEALSFLHPGKVEPKEEMVKAHIASRPDDAEPGVCIGGILPNQGDEKPLEEEHG